MIYRNAQRLEVIEAKKAVIKVMRYCDRTSAVWDGCVETLNKLDKVMELINDGRSNEISDGRKPPEILQCTLEGRPN